MNKSLVIKSIVIGFITGIALYAIAAPNTIHADLKNTSNDITSATLVKDGHLTVCMLNESSLIVVSEKRVTATGYSSRVQETDDTPFITASGKHVQWGIVAINGLKFGTKVRFPELFGDELFVVQDRMNESKGTEHADFWFAKTSDALKFGAKFRVKMQIVQS